VIGQDPAQSDLRWPCFEQGWGGGVPRSPWASANLNDFKILQKLLPSQEKKQKDKKKTHPDSFPLLIFWKTVKRSTCTFMTFPLSQICTALGYRAAICPSAYQSKYLEKLNLLNGSNDILKLLFL